MFRLVAVPHPFSSDRTIRELQPGPTIRDLVEEVQPITELQHAHVLIGDEPIPESEWNTRRPADGDLVIIRIIPAGGAEGRDKSWIGVLAILVGVLLLFIPGTAVIGIGLITAGAGVYTVLNLLSPLGDLEREKSPPSIRGARNQANPWGSVPVILGKHLVVPPYGAMPYTEIVGTDQYLRLLFILGYSPLTVGDLKIGDTAIAQFDDVEYEILQDSTPSTLFPDQIQEAALNILLEQSAGGQVQTTEMDTDEVSVDITFPQGLVEFEDDGDKKNLTVVVTCEYSPTGVNDWTLFHTFSITAKQQKTLRYGKRYTLPSRGQYDIRLTRTTADRTGERQFDKVYWTALRSITDEDPVAENIRAKVVRVAMRIRATDQLSGVVDQFNAVCTSKVPVYSGSGSGAAQWTTVEASQNPAALLLYMLRGEPAPKPVPDDRIDWPAFEAWYQWCASSGHACNAVHGSGEALRTILNRIASTGRASVSVRDGKYSVIYDIERTTVIQLFTPRNSWGFEGQKAFIDPPHALKLRFISEPAGWQQDEITVYDDGYSADGAGETEVATEFKTVEIWGITDPDQLWKDGRYQLAAIKLRPEIYSFYADVESIVCQRGDLIRVQHDVPLLGISSGRIKSLTTDGGGNVTAMGGDETFLMTAGQSYAVRIRKADDTYLLQAVDTVAGEQTEVTFTTPIPAAETPALGDLYSYGLQDLETVEMVVVGIEMGEDLEAKIYCVDHSPAIYDADTGEIPEYDPQVTLPVDYQGVPEPPSIVNIRSDGTVLLASGGDYITQMLVTLAPGASGPSLIAYYEVQYRQNGTEDPWTSITLPAAVASIVDVIDGTTYDVRARAWGHGGEPSGWTATTHTVEGKTAPPSNVTGFSAAIGSNGLEFFWDSIPDLDLASYEIRVGESWAVGDTIHVGLSTRFIYLPPENGTYKFWIKALDTTSHESTTPATLEIPVTGLVLGKDYEGDPPVGAQRIVIDQNECRLEEWNGTTWEVILRLGGDDMLKWYLQARGLIKTGADISGLEIGDAAPDGAQVFDFENDCKNKSEVDPWEAKTNIAYSSSFKFGTKALAPATGKNAWLRDEGALGITNSDFGLSAWHYLPAVTKNRLLWSVAKDGTWTSRTSASARQWTSVCWSPERGLFCAVAGDGAVGVQVMTSPDGITWTSRTSASAQAWRSVCWSPELGLFCAVALYGTVEVQVMTSPDGITWTSRTSASAQQWGSVCWSPERGLFCAVAWDGAVGVQVMTSPDGITWTSRTSASARMWTSVCWSPERGLFCAVAWEGAVGVQVMTSPDGITWTSRTSASARVWRSVCWSSELGLFCAVAAGPGTTGQVMTSPDGITWTARTSASDQTWHSVCWSPGLGLFCAVASAGNVMTSPDGITWTSGTSASAQQWFSICWSPEKGLFCVVAASGAVGVQVMTDALSGMRLYATPTGYRLVVGASSPVQTPAAASGQWHHVGMTERNDGGQHKWGLAVDAWSTEVNIAAHPIAAGSRLVVALHAGERLDEFACRAGAATLGLAKMLSHCATGQPWVGTSGVDYLLDLILMPRGGGKIKLMGNSAVAGDLEITGTLIDRPTWKKIADPPTGWMASLSSTANDDSFSGGLQLDLSSVVPQFTKKVKVTVQISGNSNTIIFVRANNDAAISNTPFASGEWHTMVARQHYSATPGVNEIEIPLSSDYKAQIARKTMGATSLTVYVSYPSEYAL